MVNVLVVGPSASGKTTLCYAIVGKEGPDNLRSTTAMNYLSCNISSRSVVVWDTPACVESDIPHIARGTAADCDVVVVCYDGRRSWSPVPIVQNAGAHKCIIALTRGTAFNFPTAMETFDLHSSFATSVPIVDVQMDSSAIINCIFRMSARDPDHWADQQEL